MWWACFQVNVYIPTPFSVGLIVYCLIVPQCDQFPTVYLGFQFSSINTCSFFFLILFIYLFIFSCVGSLFLCKGFSLVAASWGHSSLRHAGLSLSRPLLLRSTGSRHTGSVVVAHGPSCSVARGIFPDQGLNPCPLHWQADSQPLCHQGSPSTCGFHT